MNSIVQDPSADAILRYINRTLLEEELEEESCCNLQPSTLHAAEKSFHDILGQKCLPSSNIYYAPPYQNQDLENQLTTCMFAANSSWMIRDVHEHESNSIIATPLPLGLQSYSSASFPPPGIISATEELQSIIGWRVETGEFHRYGKEMILDFANNRVTTVVAAKTTKGKRDIDDYEYDFFNPNIASENPPTSGILHQKGQSRGSNGEMTGGVKTRKLVDLSTLLIHCAEAVAGNDHKTAFELLMQIRKHSTPCGDGSQRLAHCFANALKARMVGSMSEAFAATKVPATCMLDAWKLLFSASPFLNISNFFAFHTIMEVAEKADRLHIIHFGVVYGFLWSFLIQHLSTRPGGPPVLRVTRIEIPEPVFDSSPKLEETGSYLASFCERLNVPFEYTAVSKKWEFIRFEDFKIDRDEMTIVTCLYRSRNLLDETTDHMDINCQRNDILSLIRRMNPSVFIHGIVNGGYNAPFFTTRFREALFYFSSLFDMLEANVSHNVPERMVLEQEIYAKRIFNVIACEGSERLERPETYKQWHLRNLRAGLRQLPLNQDIMQNMKEQVKLHYHKDFLMDEDGDWMVQGWKGRILFALSCWKSA
ncbi:hypothetical protein P3X46_015611 [Hevea brasiliensis]|uniref:Scarecrow-like protein 14 n=1 Tax=Hevea brasiliensis TaxID=3981 RepID=A0ABQ9LXV9_HEVBR|nr:scarecrow-like protein 9 [Hevea brasiliensis]KAJ9172365.1 hypothetical protein P3X46_015611 [Hevea brasiliensis]